VQLGGVDVSAGVYERGGGACSRVMMVPSDAAGCPSIGSVWAMSNTDRIGNRGEQRVVSTPVSVSVSVIFWSEQGWLAGDPLVRLRARHAPLDTTKALSRDRVAEILSLDAPLRDRVL